MAALEPPRRRTTGTPRSDATAWRVFRSQPVPGQRLFGLLRSLPGAEHSAAGLGAAMALGDCEITSLLDALSSGGLVEAMSGGRYVVSRIGAALRPEWSGAETRSVQRWYDWCLSNVAAAADLLYPQAIRLEATTSTTIPSTGLTTSAQAAAWLDLELANLRDAIVAARGFGLGRFAWLLADALRGHVWQTPYRLDWTETASAAVAAARTVGNPRAVAAAYLCLADAYFLAGELDRAEEACAAVGAHAARAGWLSGSAASYSNRGGINHRRGRLDAAMRDYLHALELFGAAGRPGSQATLYNSIGSVHLAQGVVNQALVFHRRALVTFRQLGSLAGEARTLELLAQALAAGGQRGAAQRGLVQAFVVYGRLGDRVGEARMRALAANLSAADDDQERDQPAA